jgi:hypothetical protein
MPLRAVIPAAVATVMSYENQRLNQEAYPSYGGPSNGAGAGQHASYDYSNDRDIGPPRHRTASNGSYRDVTPAGKDTLSPETGMQGLAPELEVFEEPEEYDEEVYQSEMINGACASHHDWLACRADCVQ